MIKAEIRIKQVDNGFLILFDDEPHDAGKMAARELVAKDPEELAKIVGDLGRELCE